MAPVFTPFHKTTGKVDISRIASYAAHLFNHGVEGVLVNGTVGEGVCMSVQERKQVVEAWMEAVKTTKLHVMVHVGGAALVDVQDMAKHAEQLGVGSLLCLPELFHRPQTIEELVHYMTLVSQAAPKTPLLYYHYPASTGVLLGMEQFLKVGKDKIPTLAGLKFTHNNLEEASSCLRVDDGRFAVLLGNDSLIAAGFFLGFDSLIATTLNMFAPEIGMIQKHYRNNEIQKARDEQENLVKLIEIITKQGKWVPTMKVAMGIITEFDFGAAREPQGLLNDNQVEQMKTDLYRKLYPDLA